MKSKETSVTQQDLLDALSAAQENRASLVGGSREPGEVYLRGRIWWLYYWGDNGKKIRISSKTTSKSSAKAMLRSLVAGTAAVGKSPREIRGQAGSIRARRRNGSATWNGRFRSSYVDEMGNRYTRRRTVELGPASSVTYSQAREKLRLIIESEVGFSAKEKPRLDKQSAALLDEIGCRIENLLRNIYRFRNGDPWQLR